MLITTEKNKHFKRQSHKMVKHTQTIRRHKPTNYLSVFDNFVGLTIKGLTDISDKKPFITHIIFIVETEVTQVFLLI